METKKAAIALSTMLIIIGLLTISGTVLVLQGIDATKNTTTTVSYTLAKTQIETCKEEAIREITFNTSYTGTESLTIGNTECTFTVANNAPNEQVVDVVVTRSEVVLEAQYLVDTSTMPVTVTTN